MRRRTTIGGRGLAVLAGAMVAGAALARLADAATPAPLCGAVGAVADGRGTVTDSAWSAIYAQAQPFPEFLEASRNRLPEWYRVVDAVTIADSSLARARAVGGQWRLLVVAADTCGDSLRQVPYVARLAELVPGLSLRIATPSIGAAVQEAHRSLDGRRATPTYLLLDDRGDARGCIVELPRPLRESLHARRTEGTRESNRALAESALAWYTADRGASIVHEVVELLERARDGKPMCDRGTA
jgi:hypothetical protein